jgi:endo-1,4-beta-xylanase
MLTYFRCLAGVAFLGMTVPTAQAEEWSLERALRHHPIIGVAINSAQVTGGDPRGVAIIDAQFDSVSPENVLKWDSIHPRPDVYSFSIADQYVAFGEKRRMFVVGHTLVWHNQTPAWVFRDANGNLVDRETLLRRMHDHIRTVVGRYKGRIQSWDVVNEALNEDGSLRQSLWLQIIGEIYIAKAFEYAHEADPQAQLAYNDYSLENERKRSGALALVKRLKDQGVPITTVGMQGHLSLTRPSLEDEEATIGAFGKLGLKVAISELDIDVLPAASRQQGAEVTLRVRRDAALNPYSNGLPDAIQQELAERYRDLFRMYLKHRDVVTRVTFWGVTDGDSWLNNWPVKGRTSYPVLFERQGRPKPAFSAVLAAATESSR